jgi:hypothetical protein
MLAKFPTFLLVLLVFAVIAPEAYRVRSQKLPPNASSSNPGDLETLTIGGVRCGPSGSFRSREEAALNRLRNRYQIPDHFKPITIEELRPLQQGEPIKGEIENTPKSNDPNNNERAVSMIGYVEEVSVWGCGRKIWVLGKGMPRGRESCICNSNLLDFCTFQIKASMNPEAKTPRERMTFVVKVTVRSRLLAERKLLTSNIGHRWSIDNLREKLIKKWVRFSGWLFFEPGYADRAWLSDPNDKVGMNNTIETAWGIHPVLGIEVGVEPPR